MGDPQTPDEKLADLVKLAHDVLGTAGAGSLARSLAESVIEHGESSAKPEPPKSFSFAIEEPKPE